jgi:polyisoprenoid-binding protein YceI
MTTATLPIATTWTLDPSHTTIEFSAKHLMITTVKGRFTAMEGTVTVPSDSPAAASVDITIQAASVDTRTEQRDQHLRSADFLDVEKFPTITFRSTKIAGSGEQFTMTGDLTIHGTTRSVTLDVTNEGVAKDPWGGTRMGFSATGKIDRREFGLVWSQALETGALLVSNDIKIQIEAQVVRA